MSSISHILPPPSLYGEHDNYLTQPIQLTKPQIVTHGHHLYFGFESYEEWLIQ